MKFCDGGESMKNVTMTGSVASGFIVSPDDLSSSCEIVLQGPLLTEPAGSGCLIEFRVVSGPEIDQLDQLITLRNPEDGSEQTAKSYPEIFREGGYQMIYYGDSLSVVYDANKTDQAYNISYSGKLSKICRPLFHSLSLDACVILRCIHK